MPRTLTWRHHALVGGLFVAAGIVVMAVAIFRRAGAEARPLLAEEVLTYVEVAPAVRRERRDARRRDVPPARWADQPALRDALDAVGWSMDDYVRVEGQVTAARLRIEDPELFAREFSPADAPDPAVAAVRPLLEAVRRVQAPLPDATP
jgi:hypothetical protein